MKIKFVYQRERVTRYFAFCLALLFLTGKAFAGEAPRQSRVSANTYEGKVINFTGEITHESVERFITENRDTDAQLLHLASLGGSATAAIRFGNWILDKSLDVRILVCFSACANYLFLAGKKKYLYPGSIVLWHGGMHQKDFAEGYEVYKRRKADETSQKKRLLTADEQQKSEADERLQNAYIRIRNLEDQFMARVGVNEYLFRLGQEPIWYEPDCWSASTAVLEKLGVKGIVAESDFGTFAQTSLSPMPRMICKGTPTSFELDKNGNLFAVRN